MSGGSNSRPLAQRRFEPLLLSKVEAADCLGVCERTLDGLGIPRVRIGRRILYRREDLRRYVDGLRVEGESQGCGEGISHGVSEATPATAEQTADLAAVDDRYRAMAAAMADEV